MQTGKFPCIDLVILLLYFAFLNMFNVFLTFIPRSPLVLSNNDLLDSDIRGLSRVILNFVIPKIANIARNTEHGTYIKEVNSTCFYLAWGMEDDLCTHKKIKIRHLETQLKSSNIFIQ